MGFSNFHVALSENVGLIFPMIASHLMGIMIMKTIGYNGVHNIFRHTHIGRYLGYS